MPTNTYVELDKKTTIASVDSVTFTSIPSTYTDLVLVVNGENVSSDQGLACQVGTGTIDTAVNYSTIYMLGSGSTTGSSRITADPHAVVGRMGNANSTSIIQFLNYSNATTKKTILGRGNNGAYVIQHASMWQGTTAINTIKVFNLTSVNLAAGATFSLYGIKAQPVVSAAKATGGTITFGADGYTYHAFTAGGTFTPSSALTCDALVVAGGGGSGANVGGGGGAGGLRLLASQAFANGTAYAVSVGGGGTGGVGGSGSGGAAATAGINSSIIGGALSIASSGGGQGGGGYASRASGNGGSGGGSTYSETFTTGNTGGYSPVEGFGGGNVPTALWGRGAGGGGASQTGFSGSSTGAGAGGAGVSSYNSIDFSVWLSATAKGSSGKLAGGGGGGNYNGPAAGAGGAGGGGNGSLTTVAGVAGVANTGGGAGGGGGDFSNGAAGGSGLVIIRYESI
jgi:hypothetical protein